MKALQTAELAARLNQLEYMSLKVLQLTEIDLFNYIADASLENPVIELTPVWAKGRNVFGAPGPKKLSVEFEEWQRSISDHYETPEDYLVNQILLLQLPKETENVLRSLFVLLDDNGYLNYEETELCSILHAQKSIIKEAVAVLKSLDPPGVGARDMKESLLIQLGRLEDTSSASGIVKNHLEDLAAGFYRKISLKTGLPPESIVKAAQTIASLNPRPFSCFHSKNEVEYVYPSVQIEADEQGVLQVCLLEEQPYFTINPYYEELYRISNDEETRKYLSEKINKAKLLQYAIEKRKSTLLSCASLIAEKQSDFFIRNAAPVPLTRKEIAEQISVHPSTVSRTLRGKYLMSGNELFPFSFFLNCRELGAPFATNHTITEQIFRIIKAEPPDKPYSDEKIAKMLQKKHFSVSRRTVAKYREEAFIPSSIKRAAENRYKEAKKYE